MQYAGPAKFAGIVVLAFLVGCEPRPVEPPTAPATADSVLAPYAGFAPVNVDFLPLTKIDRAEDPDSQTEIKVFLTLSDAYGSQVKSPGVLRFEIYEHLQRSAQPKGKRIHLSPDIDLTEPDANNEYWRDFLRAYEVTLNVPGRGNRTYVLEVTFLTPDGRRLSREAVLSGS